MNEGEVQSTPVLIIHCTDGLGISWFLCRALGTLPAVAGRSGLEGEEEARPEAFKLPGLV